MERMNKRFPSPSSLQELSLNVISDNILVFIEPEEQEETAVRKNTVKKYRFRDPELYLHNQISEDLMAKLMEKQLLCDATMFLFNSKNTMLKNVRLRNCEVGQVGLQVLKQHKISKLECSNLAINTDNSSSISNILGSLNEWTIANMTDANFSKCPSIDSNSIRDSLMVEIPKMKNLKYLNVSRTKLDQIGLEIICEGLKLLEKLDISDTFVEDLRPLVQLSGQLTSLSVGDLFRAQFYSHTIRQLNKLRYLDVSIYRKRIRVNLGSVYIPLYDVFADTHSLPELVFLDISGWRDFVPASTVLDYVAAHRKLRYLGCVLNDITSDIRLQNVAPPDLVIGGLEDEQQIKLALVMYRDKSIYVREALHQLQQRLMGYIPETRQDMFNLVLSMMDAHPKKFDVQLYAAGCLLLFTREDKMTEEIHPQALSRSVDLMLNAMECFPDRYLLQDMTLQILCDYISLGNTNFDHFRCAKLVLGAFYRFPEDLIVEVTCIFSFLAVNASCEETRKLGACPIYMRKLLKMIQGGIEINEDQTQLELEFTLEALWIMTTETTICTVFLDEGGAELLRKVLRTFQGCYDIEIRVLGLLLNISEEMKLRHSPTLDKLMKRLSVLLGSECFDVKCFAAGIMNYYLDWDEYDELFARHPPDKMQRRVKNAITQWKMPDDDEDDDEKVNYPGFRPFLSMLRTNFDQKVQLWVVWFIHHICTRDPEKYCLMLHGEKGHLLLYEFIQCSECDPDIKLISSELLEIMAQHVDL